jgi:predicted RNase H-like HicB family nuclease
MTAVLCSGRLTCSGGIAKTTAKRDKQYRLTLQRKPKGVKTVPLTIEVEQEEDGRWLAEMAELPGVLLYGQTRQEAIARVQALSLRVLADRLDHGESVPQLGSVFAVRP